MTVQSVKGTAPPSIHLFISRGRLNETGGTEKVSEQARAHAQQSRCYSLGREAFQNATRYFLVPDKYINSLAKAF